MSETRLARILNVLIAFGFVLWAAAFIWRTSTVAWDGQRYFCLFDDAMISMRYADNLAHHRGLVWNEGERVEGYTNLLMTLLMALPSAALEKRFAVLAVQVFGIAVSLGIAWATMRLLEELRGSSGCLAPGLARVAGFALGLSYYPLLYWPLMGMETGVLALLLLNTLVWTLRFLRQLDRASLVAAAVAGGLAFLARADSVVYVAPLLALALARAWRASGASRRVVLGAGGLYLLFPLSQLAFRAVYYGSLVPVTYTLKLEGFPLASRLANGYGFLLPFLAQTWPLFAAAAVGALSSESGRRLVAFALPVVCVLYQLSIGGDFSNYWRFVSPGIPSLLVLALFGTQVTTRWALASFRPSLRTATGLLLLLGLVLAANRPFASEILLRRIPFCGDDCNENVNIALGIRELTHQSATVGVFMAGTIPYYSERPAVDFLGKNDPHVASLPPDLSGAIAWDGMRTVPGHNKYDLSYSILSLRPVYVERCRWGRQDVCAWFDEHYREVVFKGQRLFFLRDSPFVDWRKARR